MVKNIDYKNEVIFNDISPLYSAFLYASKRTPILAAYLGTFAAYLGASSNDALYGRPFSVRREEFAGDS